MSVAARLPGTSGHYFSTPDVNLLGADTAHGYQSADGWNPNSGVTNKQQVSDADAWSGVAVQFDITGTGYLAFRSATGAFGALAPSTQYTATVRLRVPANWGSQIRLRVSDGGGSHDATVPVVAGIMTLVNTFTSSGAPTTSSFLQIDTPTSEGTTGGALQLLDACMRLGSDASFVPSLRIVGDLDMRVDMSVPDVANGAEQYVLSTRDGNSGYMMALQPTAVGFYLRHGTGSDARFGDVTGTGLVDGQRAAVRATYLGGTGWSVTVDGSAFGTAANASTADAAVTKPLYVAATTAVGSPLAADVYSAEVRDGIDGPVVAKFDAVDWVESTS